MPPLRSFNDLDGKERGQKKTDDLRTMTTLGPRTLQMSGSRNFHQGKGRVQVSLTKKLTTIFLVLSLFYRSQMVNFKETYRFSRLQMGSNFFQWVKLFPGESICLFPIETHMNLRFSRGGPDPLPPPVDPNLVQPSQLHG